MAISKMAKLIIVRHRTEAERLLEALQLDGICQVLNAEEAMVSKALPELCTAAERPREIEELLGRLVKSIEFLKKYSQAQKGFGSVLAPRTVVAEKSYDEAVSDKKILTILEQCGQAESSIEEISTRIENIQGRLVELEPWASLETEVEHIGKSEKTTSLAGLLPVQKLGEIQEKIAELTAVIEQVRSTGNSCACIIVCMNESTNEVQKLLRAADFEQANFENMTGKVAELIKKSNEELNQSKEQLQTQFDKAKDLSENLLKLEILYDHHTNLLSREQARQTAPATEQTVILEGWVKEKDYRKLEKIVSGFSASSLNRIEPHEGEEIPVDIENKNIIKPFEVITRLYGMPKHFEVDPTIFLAPFFALFFALCLTDAGYGLLIIALIALFIKKIQGDTKLMWMLVICSAFTVVAGALTGGWFGDAVQQFIPALGSAREGLMWFDPLEKPMMFFYLSLTLGYIQIQTGLVIAFVHNLKQKDYIAAVCDQLTWLIMLNSIVLFGAGKAGAIPAPLGKACGMLALVPAATIFLFSHREGGLGGRLGMGAYNLFSAIFYMGDVLSYLRLMALGMVTAGLAMAVNVIAKITLDIPYVGFLVMIIVLVGGHGFNLAISGLSAFVHTLRLQYVEFFPKFLAGGGRSFSPLSKEYKHIYIKRANG